MWYCRYYHDVYVLGFRRGLAGALACRGLRHVVAISAQGCNTTMVCLALAGTCQLLCEPGWLAAARRWLAVWSVGCAAVRALWR